MLVTSAQPSCFFVAGSRHLVVTHGLYFTGRASIVPCHAVLVGHVGIHTSDYSFLVQFELAARVEDRIDKLTITASRRLFYLVDSCFAPSYNHRILHALSYPPFAHIITKRPAICHRHCCRGAIRRRSGSWKEGWFSKRSSDGKGVFTWSVLFVVTVIDPHTFNSGNAYPLTPRQRNFTGKGSLSFGLPKSLSPAPITSLTPTRERRVGRSRP